MIWIPLDRIDNQDQGGGVALISLSEKSGRYLYDIAQEMNIRKFNSQIPRYDTVLTAIMKSLPYPIVRLLMLVLPWFSKLNPLALTQKENQFLDSVKSEPNLEVGDAIFFDKNVFHKSIPLLKGKLLKRQALVLRFIDSEARYNEIGDRVEKNVQFHIIDQIKIGHGQKFDQEHILKFTK